MLGNELADAAADIGPALLHHDVGTASRKARYWESKASTIATRLAKIQARIWEVNRGAAIYDPPEPVNLDPNEKDASHMVDNIIGSIIVKGHLLTGHRDGFYCSRCGVKRGWKRREFFATVKCKPLTTASEALKKQRILIPPLPTSFASPGASSSSTPHHTEAAAVTDDVFQEGGYTNAAQHTDLSPCTPRAEHHLQTQTAREVPQATSMAHDHGTPQEPRTSATKRRRTVAQTRFYQSGRATWGCSLAC